MLVEKEDGINQLARLVESIMELCLTFLRQAKLVSPQTAAKFVNKMTVLNLQTEVHARAQSGSHTGDFISTVF